MSVYRRAIRPILIPALVFIAVFTGHLLYYKYIAQSSSPIWWRLYVMTQTYLISFSMALAVAFGAYAITVARQMSGKAVWGSALLAVVVWFASA
jgi:hypothetical protein